MKEQIDEAIDWLKEQPVKGCITGSCLLNYFEGQDIDCFVYDEKSFNELCFSMHYNDKFTILDPLEKWKWDQYRTKNNSTFYKFGLITIKFNYNTCVEINVILKKKCKDIFSVISSFDLDIICKGYDLETKQYLDLSQNLPENKATWNRWNTTYYSDEIWAISRVLRQLNRCFKYYKRGYDTDEIVEKYLELLIKLEKYESIFAAETFNEKLKVTQENTLIVKQICEVWLQTHDITDEQMQLLEQKTREI